MAAALASGSGKPISNFDGILLPRAMEMNRLWKSVQFDTLRTLLGGYEFARRIHFFAMALLVAFVVLKTPFQRDRLLVNLLVVVTNSNICHPWHLQKIPKVA